MTKKEQFSILLGKSIDLVSAYPNVLLSALHGWTTCGHELCVQKRIGWNSHPAKNLSNSIYFFFIFL